MSKIVFAFFLFLLSCKSIEKNPAFSETLQKRLNEFKAESTCADARVLEMEFNGHTVYLFEFGSCVRDRESPVYDKNGKTLGALGGFTGNTQIEGKDFSEARMLREVWRKGQGS